MTETTHVDESREYRVTGMTCSHCAASVREEVAELPAVRTVDVDVAAGRLVVTGTDIDDDAIRAAVADAGYEVV
ncbi:heavy-metal-associated domain-containing protein [Solirubrobacter sp. CPCC 204708]|uniref:Heavy-metal-associated domain-containing protein n=1 Tax=Solirubrobacter deserti TaxID=2282478 RepID=A0ABT4RPF6_9ACTN|nr:heavy-metal-associated domain-containing protein [Solirubrobacter deserti]MBE2315735.1 heavy-metal-associated domain-containing protein [Solirubrobacter deserti]MDA0140375.1 heavy-metal-associated domain-containing protein [Solirubrobacter deserti]